MTKRLYGYIATLFIIVSAVIGLNLTNNVANAATRYCDANSIIRCGALDATELQQDYAANATGDIPAIFSHYGVSADMIANAGSAKMGTVGKNGEVRVDGQVVATNAQSVGRETTAGSTAVKIGNTTVYQRATSAVFIDETQTAFVFLDAQGQFVAAIITSCGNSVLATPTPKPAPQPVAECVAIKATRIEKDRYSFDATASASNGATISGYVFTVRSGSATGSVTQTATVTSTSTTARTDTMTFEPGTYHASVTVKTSLGDKTAPACETTFTVPQPNKVQVCNPETGKTITVDEKDASKYKPVGDAACEDIQVCDLKSKQVITIKASDYQEGAHSKNLDDCKEQPQALPSTGPADFLGGGLALGSLTAAGYYWNTSRRNLISKLLNR